MKKTIKLLGIFALIGLLFVGCATNDADDEAVFTATILHIDDASVLVEVVDGNDMLLTSHRVTFDRNDLEDIGASIGDLIIVTHTDYVRQTYPAQVTATSWALY